MESKFLVHDYLVKVYASNTTNKERQLTENKLEELGKSRVARI